ncbi:MAG: hypothetical protein Q4D93_05820 [Porphyromonas sp.]|nr:hypothetical protein [Porphyromonas sp.]
MRAIASISSLRAAVISDVEDVPKNPPTYRNNKTPPDEFFIVYSAIEVRVFAPYPFRVSQNKDYWE